MINVAGYQVMIVNEPESQSPITMLLICIEVRPCVQSLEDYNHLVQNQRSVGNEIVGDGLISSGSVPSSAGPVRIIP